MSKEYIYIYIYQKDFSRQLNLFHNRMKFLAYGQIMNYLQIITETNLHPFKTSTTEE